MRFWEQGSKYATRGGNVVRGFLTIEVLIKCHYRRWCETHDKNVAYCEHTPRDAIVHLIRDCYLLT